MIDAEEIAKRPPMKRIKPLLLGLAYDLVPFAFGLALALLLAAAAQPAHAAVHIDRPAQETAPVATKQPCTRYVVASVVYVGKDGKLHTAIIVAPACN